MSLQVSPGARAFAPHHFLYRVPEILRPGKPRTHPRHREATRRKLFSRQASSRKLFSNPLIPLRKNPAPFCSLIPPKAHTRSISLRTAPTGRDLRHFHFQESRAMPSNNTTSHLRRSPGDAPGSKCWACFQSLPPDRKNTHPHPPSNIFLSHRKLAHFSKVIFALASLRRFHSPSSSAARRYDGLRGPYLRSAPSLIHGVLHA